MSINLFPIFAQFSLLSTILSIHLACNELKNYSISTIFSPPTSIGSINVLRFRRYLFGHKNLNKILLISETFPSGIDVFCDENINFHTPSVLIMLIILIIVRFLFFQLLNVCFIFKILSSQLICIHTFLLCPTLMPRQLTISFTFMTIIWFRNLYLPRPIIFDFSKFRRVPACLLKLFMSCSANFRLSSSFGNSIISSAYIYNK